MTTQNEYNRRLALLKTEVELDIPGLLARLESGLRVLFVTDNRLGNTLDPDVLRRLGGMTMLCRHYGATVIWANDETTVELEHKKEVCSARPSNPSSISKSKVFTRYP